jgi:4-alpha-glucanotransferase
MTAINLNETLSGDKWERLGVRKRAGILVPLFSVYSQKSLGCGDLNDLKLVIDWAEKTGNSVVQLLPMNELGGFFCPYDSISSFALEPLYANVRAFPSADKSLFRKKIEKIRQSFPAGQSHVNYGIKQEKRQLLWDIYLQDYDEHDASFCKFREENAYWLNDFALFKVLKECNRGLPWFEWESGYRNHDKQALETFVSQNGQAIAFHLWMQWQLYLQFLDVKRYAQDKGILLKGDLPILVSRDSADVWAHPEFFKLEYAAGAPPDAYCSKGQRWGMPIYNWDAIASSDYRYVKEKLRYAQNFYDILRIDHVVGLFRIWSIPYSEPKENQGLHGHFDPSDEKKWKEHGKNLLSLLLKNTSLLLCAEDLGVIPIVCPQTLSELGIPGNDVQRWVKDWQVRHDFLPPQEYRYLSVTMLSTHDTTNWPAWWENEAGTVDEGLFARRCAERGIDYQHIKDVLFDASLSRHGRLRWLHTIDSVDKFIAVLGKKREEVKDFIEMYENSYLEKEKLWKLLGMPGAMQEKCSVPLIQAVLQMNLRSGAVFTVQLINDWLFMGGFYPGDPYLYRVNTPGTTSDKNWSLVLPVSLEELLKHKVCTQIKKMIRDSGRNA